MKIDSLGIPSFDNDDMIDAIYTNDLSICHQMLLETSADVSAFNDAALEYDVPLLKIYKPLDVSKESFDKICQSEWIMPDHYKNINLYEYLKAKISTSNTNVCNTEEYKRVEEELEEYNNRGMHDLLRYLIYLVDVMKKHDIVWGVGRGSSVASYVLYLLEIHCVDSIKYNLDWNEFLR